MEEYQRCLCFDGDDTLWFNTYKYHLPMLQCAEIVCSDLGVYSVHPRQLMEMYNTIDKENVAKYGFDKSRFPSSWVEAYRKICEERKIAPKKSIEKKLYQTAAKFWEPPFPLIKGVVKTLKTLRQRGYYLVLLTVGDPDVQKKKIDSTGIKKYFHEIVITENDKSKFLKDYASKFGPENVFMIGNSKRSDVSAAIKAGVRAIYIPWATWDYEEWEGDEELYKKYVIEVDKITKILKVL